MPTLREKIAKKRRGGETGAISEVMLIFKIESVSKLPPYSSSTVIDN